jgi:hypothetical protein
MRNITPPLAPLKEGNYFHCNNNHLQLSDLYAIKLIVDGSSHFGSQYLSATHCNINTELFAVQSVFEGIFTKYTVEINGEPAPESTYSVTDGKLTFHTLGNYTVTMTNDAIISPENPAKVIVDIAVVPLGIAETEALSISVYPNPTNGELRIQVVCHQHFAHRLFFFSNLPFAESHSV